MRTITIDVELSEIDTDDLVDELCDRIARSSYSSPSAKDKAKLIKVLGAVNTTEIALETGFDRMKLEHFAKVFQKYTLAQIEQALPEF